MTLERCKHGMVKLTCATCMPPRPAAVPQKATKATPSSKAAARTVSDAREVGFVVVSPKLGQKNADVHLRDMLGEPAKIVHVQGNPFVWLIEAVLRNAPNLEVIQFIPSMFERLSDTHRALCKARGVELRAGHVRPDLAWSDTYRICSKHYAGQCAFMQRLAPPQRALFDELRALGFEAAAMASRYYCMAGEEPITQQQLAKDYGWHPSNNHVVSAIVLAVLHYLDETVQVGEGSKTRAKAMRARVERLRPIVASAAARERLAEQICAALADDLPLARVDVFGAVVAAARDGRLERLRVDDGKGWMAIRLRFGLDGDYQRHGVYRTLLEVGSLMGGITRERARQLEERALRALGIEDE